MKQFVLYLLYFTFSSILFFPKSYDEKSPQWVGETDRGSQYSPPSLTRPPVAGGPPMTLPKWERASGDLLINFPKTLKRRVASTSEGNRLGLPMIPSLSYEATSDQWSSDDPARMGEI